MRNYRYCEIEERSYEKRMLEQTNKVLISNFNKVAQWIETHCPNLNGTFSCRHDPYYWVKLVVEDGKAYLEEGSHGYGFSTSLSSSETATFSRGSMQSIPYAYDGVQFFRNDRLEEFLKEWGTIKTRVIAENEVQSNVFSEHFEA